MAIKNKKHSGGYLSAVHGKRNGEYQEYLVKTNGTNFCYALPKYESVSVADLIPNLLTLDGRDLFHQQCYVNTAAGTRGAGYIAVTTNTSGPADTDTALTTEISTNGLARVDAGTKTHTNDTNSTLIETTFTASGTHTAVHKSGMFNAASGVTLTHIANFASDATLVSGDTLKVSWTLNLG